MRCTVQLALRASASAKECWTMPKQNNRRGTCTIETSRMNQKQKTPFRATGGLKSGLAFVQLSKILTKALDNLQLNMLSETGPGSWEGWWPAASKASKVPCRVASRTSKLQELIASCWSKRCEPALLVYHAVKAAAVKGHLPNVCNNPPQYKNPWLWKSSFNQFVLCDASWLCIEPTSVPCICCMALMILFFCSVLRYVCPWQLDNQARFCSEQTVNTSIHCIPLPCSMTPWLSKIVVSKSRRYQQMLALTCPASELTFLVSDHRTRRPL